MAHQAVDLIDGDDARLLVDQAVAADGAQDLRVGQRLQDRIAFQFVERENARLIQSRPPRVRSMLVVPLRNDDHGPDPVHSPAISSARSRAMDLHGGLVAQTRQHITDRLTGRREIGRDSAQIRETAIERLQRLAEQPAFQVLALPAGKLPPQAPFRTGGWCG